MVLSHYKRVDYQHGFSCWADNFWNKTRKTKKDINLFY